MCSGETDSHRVGLENRCLQTEHLCGAAAASSRFYSCPACVLLFYVNIGRCFPGGPLFLERSAHHLDIGLGLWRPGQHLHIFACAGLVAQFSSHYVASFLLWKTCHGHTPSPTRNFPSIGFWVVSPFERMVFHVSTWETLPANVSLPSLPCLLRFHCTRRTTLVFLCFAALRGL